MNAESAKGKQKNPRKVQMLFSLESMLVFPNASWSERGKWYWHFKRPKATLLQYTVGWRAKVSEEVGLGMFRHKYKLTTMERVVFPSVI